MARDHISTIVRQGNIPRTLFGLKYNRLDTSLGILLLNQIIIVDTLGAQQRKKKELRLMPDVTDIKELKWHISGLEQGMEEKQDG